MPAFEKEYPCSGVALGQSLIVCLVPQDRTTRKLDLLRQQNMEMAAQEVQARVAGEPDIDVLTAATPVHRQYVMQNHNEQFSCAHHSHGSSADTRVAAPG